MKKQKYKMQEIYQGLYDGPHATPPVSDSGAVFLGISNITLDGHIDYSDIRYINEIDLPKWTKRVTPKGGDIVFSYEATLNLYAIIPEGFWGCLGRRMALIRPDESKALGKYLYYYFYSDEWRATIAENTIAGSTVDRIPIAKFPEFPITLPDLSVQKKIADTLSVYDDLIENNQKQIKLLEEAAQRLYKEWFVDFRFPGHEDIEIVDGVPDGWKKGNVGHLFKTVLGGTPSRNIADYWGGDIPWINSGEVNKLRIIKESEFITGRGLNNSSTKLMPKHTTVLAITGATLGQVSYTEIETCANQSVVGVYDETGVYSAYIYLCITNEIKKIISEAIGGAQQHINKEVVNKFEILLPNFDVNERMKAIVVPVFDKITNLYFEIERLSEARDRLLPKLMSGEIEV